MITSIRTRDLRYDIGTQAGSDAIHKDPKYSYAVTLLQDSSGHCGSGWAFTLGAGNNLVCEAALFLAQRLQGRDIEEIMADFGNIQRAMANEQQYRWPGPHKGLVHLALASVTNACWDLWAKKRGVPLWQLLLDLETKALLATMDFSYVEDELSLVDAATLIENERSFRKDREGILKTGYPGYDTSIGWFNYTDGQIRENVRASVDAGFTAMKLKVGAPDMEVDLRRTALVREGAGADATVMVDCNQQWTLERSLEFGRRSAEFNLLWIEEPTHPDDILAVFSVISAIIIHIGFSLLTGAIVLSGLFGVNPWVSIVVIAVGTALYVVVGGLMAVVFTERVETVVLLLGAALITWFSFKVLGGDQGVAGGWSNLVAALQMPAEKNMLSMLRPSGDASGMPWYAIFLGYPVLGIWYWCADQTIVQRVLGAKDKTTPGLVRCLQRQLRFSPFSSSLFRDSCSTPWSNKEPSPI